MTLDTPLPEELSADRLTPTSADKPTVLFQRQADAEDILRGPGDAKIGSMVVSSCQNQVLELI